MTNLILSFNVVAPLLILMLLGMGMKKAKLLDDHTVKMMNTAVFHVFIPILIFYNVYTSDISEMKNLRPAVTASVVLVCAFIAAMIIVPLIEKDNRKRGVMVQGMCRSNFVIFGVPLSVSLCGEQILGKVALAVAIVIPIINLMSVVALEFFRGNKPDFKKILWGIVTNPLVISSVLGIIVLMTGLKFPSLLEKSMHDLSSVATPFALILLGASINLGAMKKTAKQLSAVLIAKLLILPAVGFLTAVIFKLSATDIAVFIAIFASPTAVSSYTMAQQMDGDDELAAQIVAFGTAVCVLTVFVWVFILKQINLI